MSPTSIPSPASPAGGRAWSAPASRSTPTAISSSAPTSSAAAWARPVRASINPATGSPMGSTFPVITVADMVRAQARLLDHLGIDRLFCVLGGSMGGMQVLEWAATYQERVFSARADRLRRAPFLAEHRLPRGRPPGGDGRSGLVRRPLSRRGQEPAQRARRRAHGGAHHLSVGRARCTRKFGRNLQDRDKITFGFDADFQVESYLRHQGLSFVDRFDANSYLYITRAMDYFDLAADHGGVLANAFAGTKTRFCLVSFTSDWLFPTEESRADRACAERRRRRCQLRRDQDRQRPRRLPARRAGAVRHHPRLHSARGQRAQPTGLAP